MTPPVTPVTPTVVAGTSTLVLQSFADPNADRSGTSPVAGFQVIVSKDGVQVSGSPFTLACYMVEGSATPSPPRSRPTLAASPPP